MAPLVLASILLAQTPAKTSDPVEVPFRQLSFGSNGKIKDGGASVIRDEKAYAAYRKDMGFADLRKPTVDWAKEQLVEVHTSGAGYGGSSLTVDKVRRKTDGSLEIAAWIDRSAQPSIPTPGAFQVLRNVGLYNVIAVPKGVGTATLKIVEPPARK